MKRPVALSLRLISVAALAALALTACASTTPSVSHSPATSIAKHPTTQPAAVDKQASDAVPASTQCNQDTRPAYVPDNSQNAFVPGGGATYHEIYSKAFALESSGGEHAVRVFNSLLPVDFASGKGVASIVKGVMCPDGHIYVNGDPHALITHATLLDSNSNGLTAKPRGSGTFSHDAAEVLQAPCAAFIIVLGTLPNSNTKLFSAVCENNGDALDLNSIFP